MHIQVTIISRLKAARFKAKGRGKAAQRESGGRGESREGDREFFLFFKPSLSTADISPGAKQPESTTKKKKYSCRNAKRFLNEPLPPEKQLLILKGCCCTRPSGCAVKSSVAAAELRFLSDPICPSDIIHSQMLSHHFFPHHCCVRAALFICRQFAALPSAKMALPRSLQEAERQHPRTTDAQKLVSL